MTDFNPRTHVGCDHIVELETEVNSKFQSTHPRGVRRSKGVFENPLVAFQSTHPRGVRPRRMRLPANSPLFQSTHPRGVRHGQEAALKQQVVFQSTHPRGVRRPFRTTRRRRRYFNPRTHVGCDRHDDLLTEQPYPISIHAPTWGATSYE